MTNGQLHPMEMNPHTREPFLRLKNHQNVILTPPRPSDTSCYPPILNDPRVHEELIGPPIPFLPGIFIPFENRGQWTGITLEHAKAFFAQAQASSNAVLYELNAAKDVEVPLVVRHCPVNAIREVKKNGEDIFLGDISLRRCTDARLLAAVADNENRNYLAEENSCLPVGDPKIIWTIGCRSMAPRPYLSADWWLARLPSSKPLRTRNHDGRRQNIDSDMGCSKNGSLPNSGWSFRE
jgi:hypothetical protein